MLQRQRPANSVDPLARGLDLARDRPEMEQWIRATLAVALTHVGHAADALRLFSSLGEPHASDPGVRHWREQAERAVQETREARSDQRPASREAVG